VVRGFLGSQIVIAPLLAIVSKLQYSIYSLHKGVEMDLELYFSAASLLAVIGWIVLLFYPLIPKWSDKISGLIIPLVLSLGYLIVVVFYPSSEGGGFSSLAEVSQLFSHKSVILAAWVHFLAFDLFIGSWVCKTARQERISYWLTLPCLPLVFIFGPIGFLAFSIVRKVAGRDDVSNLTGV